MEQIAHGVHEHHLRSGPKERFSQFFRNQTQIEALLVGVARHAAKSFGERFGVTMGKPGLILVQPRTGFQVVSVHSIFVLVLNVDLRELRVGRKISGQYLNRDLVKLGNGVFSSSSGGHTMSEPLLKIRNNCRPLWGSSHRHHGHTNVYVGHFQNVFGEQWIFTYDYRTKKADSRAGTSVGIRLTK